jgi:NADH-quinone oxidoreductase subunit G
MNDKVITIEVDGVALEARPGQMLIEVTDANAIYVPRFCYHNKLSVAANCRMCLVEVEKAPKPLPACATPVMDGMKVKTNSAYAREAQKSVMEFLLINHPLDCPICDQGGECELQDLAMGYGRDVSRYQENKRVVKDQDIGPLVQTDMTRCIHCTRCVRFGEEIAGLRELGGTGRGEHMEIGTYVEQSMASELSGNVIDLCPVGALTSKPFRFSARTWEMRQFSGIAPHDSIGSNVHFHVKGQTVKRVVPAQNESINEIWLSDRDRFSYEGMYSSDRLTVPMIKERNAWREVDWDTALQKVKQDFGAILSEHGTGKIGALVSPASTTEELYLLQGLMRGLGSDSIDHRLNQVDFADQDQAPLFPWLGCAISDLEKLNAALIIAGNPRKEQPMLNHRLRKAALKGAQILVVNAVDYAFNYKLAAKAIAAPRDLVQTLAAIAGALLEQGAGGADQRLPGLVQAVPVTHQHRDIAAKLRSAGAAAVLLGDQANTYPWFSSLRYLAGMVARLSGAGFGYFGGRANTTGAWLAGAVPHRGPGGSQTGRGGFNAYTMLDYKLPSYLVFNTEPERDCWDGQLAVDALQSARCVVCMTAYRTPAMEQYADILLPIAVYAENEGSYFNIEGHEQRFSCVVAAPGEARPGWKVLRVLANSLGIAGMAYNTLDEVRDEFSQRIGTVQPANLDAWLAPEALPGGQDQLFRITDFPMNSLDPLVRRAPALQHTADVADGTVHVSTATADTLGLTPGSSVRVKQDGYEGDFPLTMDERLPRNTILIQAAFPGDAPMGPWVGEVSLEQR